jgi:hypothetical protein
MHSALRAQDLRRFLSNAVNALQLLAVPAGGGLWRGRVRRGRAVQLPVRAVCPWDTEPRPGVRVVPTQHVFQCKPDDELRRLRRETFDNFFAVVASFGGFQKRKTSTVISHAGLRPFPSSKMQSQAAKSTEESG